MGKQIRFKNILVGSIVLYTLFRLWWNGYLEEIPFLMMGEDPYAITNPIANSLFGTLLLLALDAVNFVGDITIKLFMYVYYAICDIVYGSKSVSDLLKNQPDEPILPIEPTEPVVIVEPAESGSPTTNELLMTVIANQNDMNTRLSKLEEKFKIHISGN